MATIPEVDLGPLPASGVPRAALPNPGAVAQTFSEGGAALENAGQSAAKDEYLQALTYRRAQEAKQAIVNEVDATRTAGDFEEQLRGQARSLQEQFNDNPQGAIQPFLDSARRFADGHVNDAPNSEVGLAVARKTASSIDSAMTQMHSWADARDTQRSKNIFSDMVGAATKGAESQPNLGMLQQNIADVRANLAPIAAKLHVDADGELRKLATEMTKSWFIGQKDRDPVNGLNSLAAAKGPQVDHLSVEQRDSLHTELTASLDNWGKAQQSRLVAGHVGQVGDLYEAYKDGSLNSTTIAAVQRANLEARLAEKTNPSYTGQQQTDNVNRLKETGVAINAMRQVYEHGIAHDAQDDHDRVAELIQAKFDLTKKDKGAAGKSDLQRLADYQDKLLAAAADKKLSGGTFATMFTGVALDLQAAQVSEKSNTWHVSVKDAWTQGTIFPKTPREAGNDEMNGRPEFKSLDAEKQNAARLMYMRDANAALKAGAKFDDDTARKSARRAVSLISGVHIK